MGPPGSGKGTQAKMLKDKLKLNHISTGDIFREAIRNKTEKGILAKTFIDKGELVPDEVTVGIVEDHLKENQNENGFIFDGFPRTKTQASALDKILERMGTEIKAVINLEVNEDVILKRLAGRRVCESCGKEYHLTYKPPKQEDTCDACKTGKLIQREDDKKETILNRLTVFSNQSLPVIKYYEDKGKLKIVAADGDIKEIRERVLSCIEKS